MSTKINNPSVYKIHSLHFVAVLLWRLPDWNILPGS